MSYQKILCVTDLSELSKHVCWAALNLARSQQSTLMIAHIIEPIGVYGRGFYYLNELEQNVESQAIEQLAAFSKPFGISKPHQHLCYGNPKKEIVRLAEDLAADLIVLGSHGAGGIQSLLGSTASYVLAHAHCDVLTVPLQRFESECNDS